MPAGFRRLYKQSFTDIEKAAKAWQRLSEKARDGLSQHRKQVTGPLHKQGWKGEAADSGFYFMENIELRLSIVQIEAQAIARVLDTTKWRMEQAQTDLRNAVKTAEDNHYRVDDDGWVSAPASTDSIPRNDPDGQTTLNVESSMLGEYRQWIQQALDDARTASDEGKRALSRLLGDILRDTNPAAMAETVRDIKASMGDLGIQDPQVPDDPKEAKEWWDALSREEREEMIALYPDIIGRTDGLPASVRNEANHLSLDQQLDIAQNDNTIDKSHSTDDYNQALNNLQKLKDRLDQSDGAPRGKELYLLKFDGFGDGKAVIAMGNPDTAAHTAVLVPGTDTTMDSVPGQVERISRLQNEALKRSNGESVSTIFWLDYDAPEKNLSVASDDRAQDAADDLRKFTGGVRAAQGDNRSHLTVIGHSYGSTTVGAAAAGGKGIGADDVIFVGSPGTTVANAGDLNMDRSHVWAGASHNDPIVNWASGLTLGTNPAEHVYGANVIEVGNGGHSSYFHDKTPGLYNQARIIVGQQPTSAEPWGPEYDPIMEVVPGL
ncbi:alpha/beta hydrolase [Streptomyces hygroscopicus]|uniref:alpha/beta hydrolase n=1 Tax=Streptomyces hygroscopicus TaxID=1912 RepID=UPI0036B35B0D